jgi:hypothetical protein
VLLRGLRFHYLDSTVGCGAELSMREKFRPKTPKLSLYVHTASGWVYNTEWQVLAYIWLFATIIKWVTIESVDEKRSTRLWIIYKLRKDFCNINNFLKNTRPRLKRKQRETKSEHRRRRRGVLLIVKDNWKQTFREEIEY